MGGLIGLDWGTSALRAYRFDAAGVVVETRRRGWGITRLPEGGFAAALTEITDGWPHAWPRIACGMVGSRNGWREVPYLGLPAGAPEIAAGLARIPVPGGTELHLVPGLRDAYGPDVMRGEETQIVGALAREPGLADASTWVLPGTHSKWIHVRGGRIASFRTVMTGELFAILCAQSILAVNGPDAAGDPAAFERGVTAARDSGAAGALSRLFSARVLMLDGSLAAGAVRDYLSGLLIGEECRMALAAGWMRAGEAIRMAGEPDLCARYRRAAAVFDITIAPATDGATVRGLQALAVRAGLIGSTSEVDTAC